MDLTRFAKKQILRDFKNKFLWPLTFKVSPELHSSKYTLRYRYRLIIQFLKTLHFFENNGSLACRVFGHKSVKPNILILIFLNQALLLDLMCMFEPMLRRRTWLTWHWNVEIWHFLALSLQLWKSLY